MYFPTSFVLASVLAAPSVLGHGVITQVTGSNGVNGAGFGVDPSTPRDGSKRVPFQQDSSIIRNNEIQSGKTEACGRTLQGGNNDIAAQMQAASTAGMPAAAADGTVTMTVHQVNADGAGPYKCDVSTDGSGQNFQQMQVKTNVPGFASLSLAKAQDFPLTAQMPAGATCTGGPNGNACLVRCRNSAIAGPFGSCVAVTNAGAAGGGNGTEAAAGAASAAGAAGAAGTAAASGATASKATTNGAAAGAAGADAGGAGGILGKIAGAAGAGGAEGAGGGVLSKIAGAAGAGGAGGAGGGILGKLAGAAGKQNRAVFDDDISNETRELALATDAEEDNISDADRDAALAQDLERRMAEQKRVLKSRIVGSTNAGRWI